jgi:hypothetical protein
MSSMTGASYVVDTAAEILAREQRVEWDRYVQRAGVIEHSHAYTGR